MIIEAGPEEAVSFTDDTSPDTRQTKKRNVSIHAKVRRGNPLTWYYDLIKPFQQKTGELKSSNVLIVFKKLTPLHRARLWDTLKEVQINITDSLPYQERASGGLKRALNRDDAVDYIRQKAIANDPHAKMLLEMLNNHTAESILLDAPSRKLTSLAYYARNYPMGGFGLGRYMHDSGLGFPRPPEHEIPLSHFEGSRKASIVRAVTEWTAKSASVFSDAIDNVSFNGFYHHHPLMDPVYRALQQSHAFDKGNKKLVNLTEDERQTVAGKIGHYRFWQKEYPFSRLRGDVDSRESFYIQASDVAAGIAKTLYEGGGVLTVTLNFEYVMFNGKRISQNEAYETMDEWRRLGYYD